MGDYDVEYSRGMRVVHDGPRQAPPLLLIHGSGASGASWGPMVGALAGHHHVIRVDLPGCGQSPPAPSYDVLGRQGAWLNCWTTSGCGTSPWPGRRSDAMICTGINATTARPVDIPGDAVADLRNISYRVFRKVLRSNAAYVAERSVPERLADLDLPVLVICGAADPRYDPSSAHQYDAVPGAHVEMLPGVGHVPMLEAAETTTELLLGFTAAAADSRPAIPEE